MKGTIKVGQLELYTEKHYKFNKDDCDESYFNIAEKLHEETLKERKIDCPEWDLLYDTVSVDTIGEAEVLIQELRKFIALREREEYIRYEREDCDL